MNKTIKLLALNLAILAAVPAFADETKSFCDMTQAQADVQKQLLGSASLFATTGNPATGNSSTITMGISKSLSKHIQSRTTGELADATCESYRLDRKLAEQAQNVEQRGDLLAFGAMEPLLRKALELANANIEKEKELRKVNASTLTDVKTAYDARDTLTTLLATLQQTRSRIQDQLPEVELPLRELVQEDIAAKADVASKTSKLQAESAWDWPTTRFSSCKVSRRMMLSALCDKLALGSWVPRLKSKVRRPDWTTCAAGWLVTPTMGFDYPVWRFAPHSEPGSTGMQGCFFGQVSR
jgi:hypothetical protein